MDFQHVRKILAEQLRISEDKITPDSDIISELGADSVNILMLLMTLEEETGRELPQESLSEIHTVQDIITFIEKYK